MLDSPFLVNSFLSVSCQPECSDTRTDGSPPTKLRASASGGIASGAERTAVVVVCIVEGEGRLDRRLIICNHLFFFVIPNVIAKLMCQRRPER